MAKFTPGLCSVTFRRLGIRQILELAQAADLPAIEWGSDVHVPPGQIDHAWAVHAATREAGLKPVSYGSYIAPPDSGMDAFEHAVLTASTLGCTNIRIWPGRRGRSSGDYSERERTDTAARIREMAAFAGDKGIAVSLEYHPRSLTDNADSAIRLIEQIDHDNIYLYWQPRPGLPLEEALTEIDQVGAHLSHMHVFAWDEREQRYPLAAQESYWRSIFRSVPESRFPHPRYALLEFVAQDSPRNFAKDTETLRELLRNETA